MTALCCRLETDIHTLEQHLESMRAAYQLNQEKLDYNYRVLLERDAENQATITQQKRKVSKQRDLLTSLTVCYTLCICMLNCCIAHQISRPFNRLIMPQEFCLQVPFKLLN